ncbi:MAG: hypothetical protein AB1752_13900 [Candidatus Zixiibacteriota bacterium]
MELSAEYLLGLVIALATLYGFAKKNERESGKIETRVAVLETKVDDLERRMDNHSGFHRARPEKGTDR